MLTQGGDPASTDDKEQTLYCNNIHLTGISDCYLINYATQLIVEDLNILFFVAICIEFVLIILFRTPVKPINNIPEIADNE